MFNASRRPVSKRHMASLRLDLYWGRSLRQSMGEGRSLRISLRVYARDFWATSAIFIYKLRICGYSPSEDLVDT